VSQKRTKRAKKAQARRRAGARSATPTVHAIEVFPLESGERVLVELPSGVKHGTVLETNDERNRLTVVVDGDAPLALRIFEFQLNSECVRRTTIIDEIAELNKEL